MEIIEEDIDVRTPTYSLEISPEVTEVPLKVEKVFEWTDSLRRGSALSSSTTLLYRFIAVQHYLHCFCYLLSYYVVMRFHH